MSEGELHVPRLGRVDGRPGFRLVAAMNPFDAVGTARISGAIYDRVCRLAMGYQSAAEEAGHRRARRPRGPGRRRCPPAWVAKVVALVRATRSHPDVRVGSSVRGAIDLAELAAALGEVRGRRPPTTTSGSTPLWWRCRAGSGSTSRPAARPRTWCASCGRRRSALRRAVTARAVTATATTADPACASRARAATTGRTAPTRPTGSGRWRGRRPGPRSSASSARTTSRRELARHAGFDEVSPERGRARRGGPRPGPLGRCRPRRWPCWPT